MSRYNRRTFPAGNKMVDWGGRPLRPSKRKTARFALHETNPPGTKIVKRARGRRVAHQFHFHGGELTKAAAERSAKRLARKGIT